MAKTQNIEKQGKKLVCENFTLFSDTNVSRSKGVLFQQSLTHMQAPLVHSSNLLTPI